MRAARTLKGRLEARPTIHHNHRLGWSNRQVMARTSSKRFMDFEARCRSIAPASTRSRRWEPTSLAETKHLAP